MKIYNLSLIPGNQSYKKYKLVVVTSKPDTKQFLEVVAIKIYLARKKKNCLEKDFFYYLTRRSEAGHGLNELNCTLRLANHGKINESSYFLSYEIEMQKNEKLQPLVGVEYCWFFYFAVSTDTTIVSYKSDFVPSEIDCISGENTFHGCKEQIAVRDFKTEFPKIESPWCDCTSYFCNAGLITDYYYPEIQLSYVIGTNQSNQNPHSRMINIDTNETSGYGYSFKQIVEDAKLSLSFPIKYTRSSAGLEPLRSSYTYFIKLAYRVVDNEQLVASNFSELLIDKQTGVNECYTMPDWTSPPKDLKCNFADYPEKENLEIHCDWSRFKTDKSRLLFYKIWCRNMNLGPFDPDHFTTLQLEKDQYQLKLNFQIKLQSCQSSAILYNSVYEISVAGNFYKNGDSSNSSFLLSIPNADPVRPNVGSLIDPAPLYNNTLHQITLKLNCRLFQSGKHNLTSYRVHALKRQSASDWIPKAEKKCRTDKRTFMTAETRSPESWFTNEYEIPKTCPKLSQPWKTAMQDSEKYILFTIGSDSYNDCQVKNDLRKQTCNGPLLQSSAYMFHLYLFTSPEHCSITRLGTRATKPKPAPEHVDLTTILQIFALLKISVLILLSTIGIVWKQRQKKKNYFKSKHEKLSEMKSKDLLFDYRNPIWIKKFGLEFNTSFYVSKQKEFNDLNVEFPCPTREVAILKMNFYRNRFSQRHLPFDHALVSLDHVDSCQAKTEGYINASYIPGPRNHNKQEYIITQG